MVVERAEGVVLSVDVEFSPGEALGDTGACAEDDGVNEDAGGGGGRTDGDLGCKTKGIKGMGRFTNALTG